MTNRERTPLDEIAEHHVDRLVELHPTLATQLGIPGHDHLLEDHSPDGLAADAELIRETLAAVDAAPVVDDVDRVTKAAMQERLGLQLELHEAGENGADLNNIASPLQSIRDVFDLMPSDTEEHWENIASRMAAVGDAADGYLTTLRSAQGPRPAVRQFELGIAEAARNSENGGFFDQLAARNESLPQPLRTRLQDAAKKAKDGYARLSAGLRELATNAPEVDAVGRERYERLSRLFLGAKVDFDETYVWGQEELARLLADQDRTAKEIAGPEATLEDAVQKLNSDPARQIHGKDALKAWMQETSDAAIAALADTQFDIPEPVRELECCIAPTATGGIYYTGPSDDFSRPGRMWWSVPEGVEDFTTWYEKTTVYHEGVPGHHLQIAQTTYRRELLNSWRRNLCWVSGHGEGWALYAERLMHDLGYMDDPGDYLGLLDGQILRAARVVLDIGVHLDLEHPDGGKWSYERAWEFLRSNLSGTDAFLRFELNRYMGWAGQAPSYKIGQRLWEDIRAESEAKAGETFNLKDFHRRALDVGSVGLDVLRDALI